MVVCTCVLSLSLSLSRLSLSRLSLLFPLPFFSRLGQRRRGPGRRLRVHVRALEQLVEHLGQRRVRVHAELDVLDALPGRDGVARLVDEVGGVQADDVHAEDLARVLGEGRSEGEEKGGKKVGFFFFSPTFFPAEKTP